MKKVIFGMAVVAAAALGVYNANNDNAKAQMSDLQTENLEALAEREYNGASGSGCDTGVTSWQKPTDDDDDNYFYTRCKPPECPVVFASNGNMHKCGN